MLVEDILQKTQVTNINMARCLSHLAVNKMLIKITVRYHFTHNISSKFTRFDSGNCWQGYKIREAFKYYWYLLEGKRK
jgi:hypothetical protein